MNEIIAVIGSVYIYRHGIVMGAAAAAAVACTFILAKRKDCPRAAAAVMCLLALVLCPLCSRLVYWYCCPEQYSGFADALFHLSDGGHSIFGALAGAAGAVLLTRLITGISAVRLADLAAPGGALCICIGRLAAFFTDDDKGRIIFTGEAMQGLPFSVLVTDMATGAQEWRLATFVIESAAAGIIFILLTVLLLSRDLPEFDGRTALMFCVLYGSSQIVLESTRYDSLFLRSNGFVSLMQIAGAVMVVGALVIMSIKLLRLTGYQHIYCAYWLTALCLIGITGFLEYYVQRHADRYMVCYPIMALCMLAVSAVACILGVLIPKDQYDAG